MSRQRVLSWEKLIKVINQRDKSVCSSINRSSLLSSTFLHFQPQTQTHLWSLLIWDWISEANVLMLVNDMKEKTSAFVLKGIRVGEKNRKKPKTISLRFLHLSLKIK